MTDELDKSVEVIERWDAGGTEYSVDGGVNWWTKEQYKAIQALIAKTRINDAKIFRTWFYENTSHIDEPFTKHIAELQENMK